MITGNEKAGRILTRLEACKPARLFAQNLSIQAAWETCPRGDWLLWVTRQLHVDLKSTVRAACACARLALPFVNEGELRPLRCIEVVELWCEDKATIEEVRAASDAAHAAFSHAAYDAATAYAASAACSAASAASAAASYASSTASYASHAASDAVSAHAASAASFAACARTKMQHQTAYAVRSVIPWAVIKTALNKLDR